MKIAVDGINVNYELKGTGKPVVLLHGWGCNIKIVASIQDFLAQWFSVYSIDLPGFGESDDPKEAWGVAEYSKLVKSFIEKMQIKKPILVGHSVGGRLSIWLGANIDVDKIVLVDSAGIKKKLSLKSKIKIRAFKTLKHIVKIIPFINHDKVIQNLKNKFGSTDYKNAKPILKECFVKIVNEDLQYLMPSIKAPTLLVWGENDVETPVNDARIMNSLIEDSGIALIKNAGHYSYLDNPRQFFAVLKAFLVDVG